VKPDWAVRLQRTFARKYENGVAAERGRIIAIIEAKEWPGDSLVEDVANLLELIKGEK